MLKFLKKLFTKNGGNASTQDASTVIAEAPASKQTEAKSGVDVASLSLRAILEKLPSDLKSSVNQMPGSDVKVVLPVAAIMKQLPSGAVRMSLASLYRQAPSGTFRKTNVEDKRLVDVPLSEVFKTINPTALKRRDDQRRYSVPEDAVGLFDENNSRNVVAPGQGAQTPPPRVQAPSASAPAPEQKLRMPAPSAPARQPVPEPKAAPAPVAPQEEAAKLNLTSELSLLLVEVAAGWQEGYRNELSVLPGDTRISIPAAEVGPLLQKGKVVFTWEQMKRWLKPPAATTINIPDDAQLVLPLKIVAPAFVAATGAKKRTAKADTSLPDFFGPTAGQLPSSPATPPPAQDVPAQKAPVAAPQSRVLPPPSVSMPAAAPAPASAPLVQHDAAASVGRIPLTLRELFKMPDKTDWPPNELVKLTCALPGVAGVVVALEEGLVVAEKLPEGFSSETFAAFMPQVFSRMDRYTGEMQLGQTNDVTLNTESGAIRLFRNGKVFFAALGTLGENLPNGLHLICNELASQNS
jgi:predicted regulator of Ras-like GTPase activity (Roadblock/LC7/MglB family)